MNLPPIKTDLEGWDRMSEQVLVTAVNQFGEEVTAPSNYNYDTGHWSFPTRHFPAYSKHSQWEWTDWTVTAWTPIP